MARRYLYEDRARPDLLAEELLGLVECDFSETGMKAREAADRLLALQDQMGHVIMGLIKEMSNVGATEFLLRAGIDRSELKGCWGTPDEIIRIAEAKIPRKDM